MDSALYLVNHARTYRGQYKWLIKGYNKAINKYPSVPACRFSCFYFCRYPGWEAHDSIREPMLPFWGVLFGVNNIFLNLCCHVICTIFTPCQKHVWYIHILWGRLRFFRSPFCFYGYIWMWPLISFPEPFFHLLGWIQWDSPSFRFMFLFYYLPPVCF